MFKLQRNFWRGVSAKLFLLAAMSATTPAVDLTAQTLYSVGAANSPTSLELGEVTAAATFSDGRLVLLDGKEKALYLVGRDGKQFKKAGRDGSGPGEFRSPSKLAIDASGNVIVFDPRLRRFSWFAVSGDSLLFQRSVNIIEGVQDFCVTADRLYTLGMNARPISAYKYPASSLVLIDSLGASNLQHPLATHSMVRQYGQAGPIACGEQAKQVVWHSSQLDAGQVLSLSGKDFALRLPEFLEVVMTPIENGIRNSAPTAGVIELLRGIIPGTASNYYLVSVLERAGAGYIGYRVRTVDSNGSVSAPSTVNARLFSYRDGIAVCEPVSEVPQVFVVRTASRATQYPCDSITPKKTQ